MLGMKRTILLSSALCLVVMHNPAKASNLDRELHEVDKLRAGEETPFEQVEKMCKELLEKYTEWEEHGRIYFQLAHVYAQSGQVLPAKTIEWSKKALEYPLEPLERLQLHIYRGDAIQVAHRGVRGQDLVVARRKAVMPYLHGLKESLTLEYSSESQDEQRQDKGDRTVTHNVRFRRGPSPEMEAQRKKALEDSKRARFQDDLNQHRKALTGQISYMYSRFPWASDEIRELSTKILEDKTAVERLMSFVDRAVKKRAEEMMGEPELPEKELPKDSPKVMPISKDNEIFIPETSIAQQQGKAFILDFASGTLMNPTVKTYTEKMHKVLTELGKGDLAWDGSIVTVRKAKALTVLGEATRPLKCTPARWCNRDKLPENLDLPYSLLVFNDEGVDYLVTIHKIESNGIRISYKQLTHSELPKYLVNESP